MGLFSWIPITFLSYVSQFFLDWEMFQTKVVEKIKTHILCLETFFENHAVYEIMWKIHCRAGQATDYIMAHTHCMLDTYGYKHTLKIYNTYCSSITTMVTWICPNFTCTYIACLVIHIRGYAIKIRDVLLLKIMRYWGLFPAFVRL